MSATLSSAWAACVCLSEAGASSQLAGGGGGAAGFGALWGKALGFMIHELIDSCWFFVNGNGVSDTVCTLMSAPGPPTLESHSD